MKAVVIMGVRRLHTVHALVSVLEQAGMVAVRADLSEDGRVPSRRTFERRLPALPAQLPAQIAQGGAYLLRQLDPWAQGGRAVALDSTPLRARGRAWHQRERRARLIPHTQIATQAHWTHSGWHGWVYGYKLHLLVSVGPCWIPLAAELTPANRADNKEVPALLSALDASILPNLFVLADGAYNDPTLLRWCAHHQATLLTTQRGPYPHHDAGVAVRRFFHQLRTHAIETFTSQFKAIFDGARPLPTKCLLATQRWVLGAVFIYQLALLARFRAHASLRRGLKPFLHAA